MIFITKYRRSLRRRTLKSDGAFGLPLVAQIDLALFWAISLIIAWASSYLVAPWPTVGLFTALAIIALSLVLVVSVIVELRSRAAILRDQKDDR